LELTEFAVGWGGAGFEQSGALLLSHLASQDQGTLSKHTESPNIFPDPDLFFDGEREENGKIGEMDFLLRQYGI
jgi:hypothetical protein